MGHSSNRNLPTKYVLGAQVLLSKHLIQINFQKDSFYQPKENFKLYREKS